MLKLTLKSRKAQTEDYFADLPIGLLLIVIGIAMVMIFQEKVVTESYLLKEEALNKDFIKFEALSIINSEVEYSSESDYGSESGYNGISSGKSIMFWKLLGKLTKGEQEYGQQDRQEYEQLITTKEGIYYCTEYLMKQIMLESSRIDVYAGQVSDSSKIFSCFGQDAAPIVITNVTITIPSEKANLIVIYSRMGREIVGDVIKR